MAIPGIFREKSESPIIREVKGSDEIDVWLKRILASGSLCNSGEKTGVMIIIYVYKPIGNLQILTRTDKKIKLCVISICFESPSCDIFTKKILVRVLFLTNHHIFYVESGDT